MHGLNFLNQQYDTSMAYITYYDNVLVLFSYLIACLAAYTAWNMASLYAHEKKRYKKTIWLTLGGLVMGSGIWAMHFVAMLAYRLPVAASYDLTITLLSVLPAIAASTMAIAIIARKKLTPADYIYGSMLFGSGICAMHYIGMGAMQMNALMLYDPVLFVLSIFVAVGLSFMALKLRTSISQFSKSPYYQTLKNGSILIMAAAMSGMHYTGMAAVYVFPIAHSDPALINETNDSLPIIIISMSMLLMLLTIAISKFEQRLKQALKDASQSSQHMHEAIDNLDEAVVLFDDEDKLVLYNDNFKKMFEEIGEWIKPGISYSELVEKKAEYHTEHGTEHNTDHNVDHTEDYINERLKWHKDPKTYFTETLNDGRHVFGKEEKLASGDSVGIWTEESDLKQVKNRLIQTDKQVQMLLDASPSPILVRSVQSNAVLYFNNSAQVYFKRKNFALTIGTTNTFVHSKYIEDLKQHILDKSNLTNVEYELTSAEGKNHTVILSATLISFDNTPSVLFSFVDISERKTLEQRINSLEQTDPLTKIYNSRYLNEMGGREVARSLRSQNDLSILLLGIDQLDTIKQTYGEDAADQAIVKLAEICQQSVREVDILGRLDDHTFAIILPDTDIRFAKVVGDRIRIQLEKTPLQLPVNEQQLTITSCTGCSTVSHKDRDKIDDMFRRAKDELAVKS
ncbi:MAG: diguanylate cyclase (GGDEF)-like protein [Phenylobacterium sp.]|jgi:diguanylate cyclase (GGDEF)-like protein